MVLRRLLATVATAGILAGGAVAVTTAAGTGGASGGAPVPVSVP